MAIVQVKDLIEAGVHFGHRASRWNPKMRPYIYGKRNLIHIIDLRETVRGMLRRLPLSDQGGQQRQPGAVRRHQAPGQGSHRTRGGPLRHAVRQRTLAGRHPDQLPHHPRPAQDGCRSWKRCGCRPTRIRASSTCRATSGPCSTSRASSNWARPPRRPQFAATARRWWPRSTAN